MERTKTDAAERSRPAERLARGGTGRLVRLPSVEGLAGGAHDLDPRPHCSPASAAQAFIATGIFERIAAEMIRIDREIRATPLDPETARIRAEAEAAAHASWLAFRKDRLFGRNGQ